MKKHSQITAFYLETLVLIVIFVSIILVLTQIFGLGRKHSTEARLLNNAVCLCSNAAEAAAASDSPEMLASLLDEGGNARLTGQGRLELRYDTDMRPDPAGSLCVRVEWTENPGPGGTLADVVIRADYEGGDAIYTLQTAVLLTEVGE